MFALQPELELSKSARLLWALMKQANVVAVFGTAVEEELDLNFERAAIQL